MTKAKLKAKPTYSSAPAPVNAYVFLVRTCVRLHRVIDGERHSSEIINTSIHANQPTVATILEATRQDPIKAAMHEHERYLEQLADCLHAFGVPNVVMANGESGTIAQYNAATVGCEWVASVENDECGHSNDDLSLGYIAISQRVINP